MFLALILTTLRPLVCSPAEQIAIWGSYGRDEARPSQVKVYSSRRQESHVQRRRVTGAGAGARGCGPHNPPVSRKSPARDEYLLVVLCRPGNFLFVFSLRCVGFSRSSVLKFSLKGSWRERGASVPERLTPPWRVSPGVVLVGVCPREHLGRTNRGRFLGLRLLL